MGVLTLLIQQFSFTKAKANVTVPCYTSASIIIALFLGSMVLNENIIPIQIIGVCFIIAGVICVSAFRDESNNLQSDSQKEIEK